jgi:hypothetical protein
MPTRYSALAAGGLASLWFAASVLSSPAEERPGPESGATPLLRLASDDAAPRDDAYHPPHPPSYYSPYGAGPPADPSRPQSYETPYRGPPANGAPPPQRPQAYQSPYGTPPAAGAPPPQRPQASESPYGVPASGGPRDDAYHPPRPQAYESPYGTPPASGGPPRPQAYDSPYGSSEPAARAPVYAPSQGYGSPYAPPPEPGYGRPYAAPGQAYDDPGAPRRYDGPPPGSYSSNEILDAGHSFFGSISKGLASVIEYAFQKQGRPNGYILGQDAGGAFVAGLRFGEGILYTRDAGTRRVYWQGPSIGWDAGAEGSKVMMLVYNLTDPEEIYQRFGGIDGSAYLVGGAGVTFQKSGDVIVAPIRAGVGLRLGANIGYLKYTRTPTWNPF